MQEPKFKVGDCVRITESVEALNDIGIESYAPDLTGTTAKVRSGWVNPEGDIWYLLQSSIFAFEESTLTLIENEKQEEKSAC